MREARLELACPSGRHPLKMVCLPVPPLAQERNRRKTAVFSDRSIYFRQPREPGAIRTHGPRLKRALLYQLSYGLGNARLIYVHFGGFQNIPYLRRFSPFHTFHSPTTLTGCRLLFVLPFPAESDGISCDKFYIYLLDNTTFLSYPASTHFYEFFTRQRYRRNVWNDGRA